MSEQSESESLFEAEPIFQRAEIAERIAKLLVLEDGRTITPRSTDRPTIWANRDHGLITVQGNESGFIICRQVTVEGDLGAIDIFVVALNGTLLRCASVPGQEAPGLIETLDAQAIREAASHPAEEAFITAEHYAEVLAILKAAEASSIDTSLANAERTIELLVATQRSGSSKDHLQAYGSLDLITGLSDGAVLTVGQSDADLRSFKVHIMFPLDSDGYIRGLMYEWDSRGQSGERAVFTELYCHEKDIVHGVDRLPDEEVTRFETIMLHDAVRIVKLVNKIARNYGIRKAT